MFRVAFPILLLVLAYSQVLLTLPLVPLFKPLSNNFTLSFEYACIENIPFKSCSGISSTDYNIKTISLSVNVQPGSNCLQVEGAGISDTHGLSVDNLKLVRSGDSRSIVVNGGFEAPVQKNSWAIYPSFIEGWQGK